MPDNKKHLCIRCGHLWTGRKDGRPEQCTKCHSPAWDKEYVRPVWRDKRTVNVEQAVTKQ